MSSSSLWVAWAAQVEHITLLCFRYPWHGTIIGASDTITVFGLAHLAEIKYKTMVSWQKDKQTDRIRSRKAEYYLFFVQLRPIQFIALAAACQELICFFFFLQSCIWHSTIYTPVNYRLTNILILIIDHGSATAGTFHYSLWLVRRSNYVFSWPSSSLSSLKVSWWKRGSK